MFRFRDWLPRRRRSIDVEQYMYKLEGKGHRLTPEGQEIPDDTVMAPPVGYVPGPDLIDQIRAMVRREVSEHADSVGFETFEEADDFEEEEGEPVSGYENEGQLSVRELVQQAKAAGLVRPDGSVDVAAFERAMAEERPKGQGGPPKPAEPTGVSTPPADGTPSGPGPEAPKPGAA